MVGKGKDGNRDGGEGHGHIKPREESTFISEEDLGRGGRREGSVMRTTSSSCTRDGCTK